MFLQLRNFISYDNLGLALRSKKSGEQGVFVLPAPDIKTTVRELVFVWCLGSKARSHPPRKEAKKWQEKTPQVAHSFSSNLDHRRKRRETTKLKGWWPRRSPARWGLGPPCDPWLSSTPVRRGKDGGVPRQGASKCFCSCVISFLMTTYRSCIAVKKEWRAGSLYIYIT